MALASAEAILLFFLTCSMGHAEALAKIPFINSFTVVVQI